MRADQNNTPFVKRITSIDAVIDKDNLALLPESVEGFNILANTAPVMLWLSGPDKNVYFVNKVWIDYRGTSFEEEIGVKWINGLHPDDREKSLQTYIEAFDARENFYMEYRLLNASGKFRWISSKGVPRFKEDGTFLGYAGSCADIDDQKNFTITLAKEVAIRSKEITDKNKELNAKNEELNSFASVASHDLKEPLRKIHLFGKMIHERETSLSESSKYNLERILISAARMQQLIDDLLSYSEINGRGGILITTDLNKLVKKVLNDLKETIEESNTVLEIEDLPTVSVIPSQIGQVFTNLFHNSIKYATKGITPTIKVTAEKINGDQMIELESESCKTYWKITVADNGIGFPFEVKEKVFDPFKRFHDKEEYGGTGIGLAICKKIIANHKGFISAESEPGNGALFSFYIPTRK